MKWLGYLCSVFFVSLGLFVGTCIINQNDVSAVSDISVTYSINDTITAGQDIFSNCSGSCLSDFNYIKVELDNPGGRYNNDTWIYLKLNNYYNIRASFVRSTIFIANFYHPSDSTTSSLTFENSSPFSTLLTGSYTPLPSTITFTLMDSLGPCPSVEPCPEIPENPYDDKLDDIKYAILIIPATALILYFFYCIYRMLLKGRL